MLRPRTNSQVSIALRLLGPDANTEFLELVGQGASNVELVKWFAERGHTVSTTSIATWIRSRTKQAMGVAQLGTKMTGYREVNPVDAMQFALGIACKNLDRIQQEIDMAVARQAEVDEIIRLEARAEKLIKEVRACALKTQEKRYVRDRDEMQMVGAEIVISELRMLFRGTASEEAAEAAIASALARIQAR